MAKSRNRYTGRYRRPVQAAQKYRPRFAEYERLKCEWISNHPDATPAEYQEAMRALAADCGI